MGVIIHNHYVRISAPEAEARQSLFRSLRSRLSPEFFPSNSVCSGSGPEIMWASLGCPPPSRRPGGTSAPKSDPVG